MWDSELCLNTPGVSGYPNLCKHLAHSGHKASSQGVEVIGEST